MPTERGLPYTHIDVAFFGCRAPNCAISSVVKTPRITPTTGNDTIIILSETALVIFAINLHAVQIATS